MAKVKETSFVGKVLAGLNKTEAQLQEEKVVAFVEDSIIECNAQIAYYKTSLIPSKELEIQRTKQNLVKAEKAYEEAKFSISNDFNNYIEKRNYAKRVIDESKSRVSTKEAELSRLQAELKAFEEVLADLQS